MEWKEEVLIPTHIEVVWKIFQDEHIQKLMPKVISHELIGGQENTTGARHRQISGEGKKQESWVVETTSYKDEPGRKEKEIAFELDNAFHVKLRFRLIKLNENETSLVYEGYKKPVTFKGKLKLKLSDKRMNEQIVKKVVQQIREETGA